MITVNIKYAKPVFPIAELRLTNELYQYIMSSTENELIKLQKQTEKFTNLYNFTDLIRKTQKDYDYEKSLELRKRFVATIRFYEKNMINNYPIGETDEYEEELKEEFKRNDLERKGD